ncbi:centromere protein C [Fagus crenata]
MVAEPRSYDPVDPLSSYSGLALFPTTFQVPPDPSKPSHADIDAIHNHLKSIALRSPNKLLEQAKMILDGSSELLNSEIANFLEPKEKKEIGVAPAKETLPERRPGLGRKRARFNLKPSLSQPAVSLEPSLDIDQLKDPEEFFSAYERLENAKREIQKQIGGVSIDLDQHNPSTTVRQRRPGILGRSVKYKHRYSSVISENNVNVVSTQETLESDIVGPTDDMEKHKTDQNVASQESELAGSMDKSEKKVSDILDELLSGNFEDLEGDGAVSILQKRLQIKPIDLEKLSLPELQDIQKIKLNTSRGNISKPRKALSDIDNLLKGISSKTPVKLIQEAEISVHHIASPTPPRSPFAPFSSLQKHILRSKPSNDPFSILDFDHSQEITSSPIESLHKESDPNASGKQLNNCDELKSPLIEEDDTAVAKTGSPEAAIGDLPYDEAIVHDNSSKASVGVDVGSSGTHVGFEDNVGSFNMDNEFIDEQLSRHDADMSARANGPNILEDKVEDMLQEPVEAVATPQTDVNMADATGENLNDIQSILDQSSPAVVEEHAAHGISRSPGDVPEQHIEESTKESLIEQNKAKSRPRREHKRKELSHRKSLAGAGLFWKSGVRRSTRIRTRPLEYWKGERLLYGRIHQSLATVIGLKYASPSKDDGEPTLKVKSYVSDEYKELVELAALH